MKRTLFNRDLSGLNGHLWPVGQLESKEQILRRPCRNLDDAFGEGDLGAYRITLL